MSEFIDIDATSGNIRCNENSDFLVLEAKECTLAIVLRLISVDGECWDIGRIEFPDNLISTMLGPREDEDSLDRLIL